MKTNKLTNWDDHLDNKYGKVGTPTRDKYEEEFEAFKIGVLIQEARKKEKFNPRRTRTKSWDNKELYISN
jgi:HTH-type transcriptional regulator/antitoxin HipB